MRFGATAAGVCGSKPRATLVYLLRVRVDLIPNKKAVCDAKDTSNLDHELVACHPVIHKGYLAFDVEDLERLDPGRR